MNTNAVEVSIIFWRLGPRATWTPPRKKPLIFGPILGIWIAKYDTNAVLWTNSFLIIVQKIKSDKSVPVAQNNINIIIYHQFLHSDRACVAQSHKESAQNVIENNCVCYSQADQHRNERIVTIIYSIFPGMISLLLGNYCWQGGAICCLYLPWRLRQQFISKRGAITSKFKTFRKLEY